MALDFLADLASAGTWLEVRCPGCKRCLVIPPGLIREHFRRNMTLDEAGKRSRCSTCGHKGASVKVYVHPKGPDGRG